VGCMAKAAVQVACTECGYSAGRWFGKCPGCNEFGTLVEEIVGKVVTGKAPPKPLLRLVDVEVEEAKRMSTGVPELDRVLGGGLVPASLVLVGGEPGVGKSTLLLTALQLMSNERRTLLITGEESVAQVKLRAERLGGAANVGILAETELDVVCETLEAERPDVCVIDSIQTLYSADLSSAPGSVAQVREAAGRLLRVSKESGVATILVGHVTKDGTVAGPRVLEHLVDCVLQFEGDRYRAPRRHRSRPGRRVRQRRRRRSHRRAGRRPCGCPRDRLRRGARARARRHRRLRRDRPHRPAPRGHAGRPPARRMRQARPHGCR